MLERESPYIKSKKEIEIIAQGGKLLGEILLRLSRMVKPGITTKELSDEAERQIVKIGGRPSFKGYGNRKNPFPAALCVSINDEVVHGVPTNARALRGGDIVGLDIGMEYQGLYTDTAITVGVGKISPLAQKLITTTKKSLDSAIAAAKEGNRMGDVGFEAQFVAERNGFSVVRDLVGHGVGYAVHEDPEVPNYGRPGTGIILAEGMVLAIEPMLCEKSYKVMMDEDGWTIRTVDRGLSAHFEHTIVVGRNGGRILT